MVVCTPVSRVAADCCDLARFAPDRALITDVGSTKAAIVSAIEHDPRARSMFCGAHPIAGSERQGVAHARADLFEGRSCVITPSLQTPSDRESRAMQFWEALGCKVLVMSPQKHDEALALTSHLPHAVASALAGTVPEALHTLAAGAFRDGTRVASADSGLWTDIFLANREGTLSALSRFEERLAKFRRALTEYDALALASWWTEGRDARDRFAFPAARPDDPAPPGDSPCST